MRSTDLIIVESPAKAKTVNKYLGYNYTVLASYGHVRDLLAKNGSVRPDEDFALSWETNPRSARHLKAILEAARGAGRVILATDPDREGEAIAWHVLEVLRENRLLDRLEIERVVFNAITKSAVLKAINEPRSVDMALVEAYLARRALDYLVGFNLSPILWRKMPGARSAGRVQSVALRLVCDREQEIELFVSREYWSIAADIVCGTDLRFTTQLVSIDNKKLDRLAIETQEQAERIRLAVKESSFSITQVETKPQKRHPYPPFTTSTLQQEASRRLGLSASRTMQIAQNLYEGLEIGTGTRGLITYMRTDGIQIAPEAVASCRDTIGQLYGDRYLSPSPRVYKTKARNAQEAHEAIRPTDFSCTPKSLSRYLGAEELKLYTLIWERAVASQMASAEFARTSVDIQGIGKNKKRYGLRATDSVMVFDGFLALYKSGKSEQDAGKQSRLPALSAGEDIIITEVTANQHFTDPPPRYTEATFIKKMEELGIGRPSTYAAILSVLNEREYIRTDKKLLMPEDKGLLVTAFLKNFFARYVEYNFTADLEKKLDLISDGSLDWKALLQTFWGDFGKLVSEVGEVRVSEVLESLNTALASHIFPPSADEEDTRRCPACEDGRLSLKIGRFGTFIGCSNYPECRHTRQFSAETHSAQLTGEVGPRPLGIDPETGRTIHLKTGRFGPYVERADEENKPDRASIPRGVELTRIDLDYALKLLSLPREIGLHPETNQPISAVLGRHGPFVHHEGTYVQLEDADELFTIGLNRAVTLLADKKEKGSIKKARSTSIQTLGKHPELGGSIQVMEGRYGPYVKHGKTNASLPQGEAPESLTLERAVQLLDAKLKKATRGGKTKKKAPKRK